MLDILLKASVYLVLIALGYGLKRAGVFQASDQVPVSRIVMDLTLPAAVVTSFAGLSMDPALLGVVALGLLCNLVLIPVGALVSRRRPPPDRVLAMQSLPGYNIGTFTMPFVQGFLGPFGVAVTCLFDTGSAIMVTGGTHAVVSRTLRTEQGGSLRTVLRTLVGSVPFLAYTGMLVLSLLRVPIPGTVLRFTAPIGAANPFLAMLMIGLMLEFRMDAARWRFAVTARRRVSRA